MMKSRYEHIQAFLSRIDTDGCYFLSLLSIAEEANGEKIDLIDAIWLARGKDYITDDYYVNDALGLLTELTGHVWAVRVQHQEPTDIADNEYTIAVWFNERTGLTHFRRRYFDTLINSITVNEGYVKEYRVFYEFN